MLKYLIIQLDDSSASFCHYPNLNSASRLMPLNTLKEALIWSMKENLSIQILYPDYALPQEYLETVNMVDRTDIVNSQCTDTYLKESADVLIFNKWEDLALPKIIADVTYVMRTTFDDLISHSEVMKALMMEVMRLNVVFTDLPDMDEADQAKYLKFLEDISLTIKSEYARNHAVQLNLLTDRILLDKMNNCNAGDESITLCPDGKFYICPAFYSDGMSVGDLASRPNVRNPQLYRLSHAPLCRICDAFQCRRCVWLNHNATLEVNTPSHQQCVMAHIERNASQKLLANIRELGMFMPGKDIPNINYLDPLDIIVNKS